MYSRGLAGLKLGTAHSGPHSRKPNGYADVMQRQWHNEPLGIATNLHTQGALTDRSLRHTKTEGVRHSSARLECKLLASFQHTDQPSMQQFQ